MTLVQKFNWYFLHSQKQHSGREREKASKSGIWIKPQKRLQTRALTATGPTTAEMPPWACTEGSPKGDTREHLGQTRCFPFVSLWFIGREWLQKSETHCLVRSGFRRFGFKGAGEVVNSLSTTIFHDVRKLCNVDVGPYQEMVGCSDLRAKGGLIPTYRHSVTEWELNTRCMHQSQTNGWAHCVIPNSKWNTCDQKKKKKGQGELVNWSPYMWCDMSQRWFDSVWSQKQFHDSNRFMWH